MQQLSIKTHHGSPTIVRAYAAANQALIAGVNVLQLNTILANHDRLNEFNVATYRFTPRRAGYYYITCDVIAQIAAGIGQVFNAYLTVNGITSAVFNTLFVAIARDHTCKPSTLIYLTPNNWVDVRAIGYALPNTVTVIANSTQIYIERCR